MVNRFDLSEDPIALVEDAASRCATQLLKNIKTWAVKGNEPNYYLREHVPDADVEKARGHAVRQPPGRRAVLQPQPPGRPGRQAGAAARSSPSGSARRSTCSARRIFKDDFFATEAELLNDLPPSRWMDWYSNADDADRLPGAPDGPEHAVVRAAGAVQPQVLQRVYDAELKSKAEDKFTAAELICRVEQIIWGDLTT